jgi:hypothetical protein
MFAMHESSQSSTAAEKYLPTSLYRFHLWSILIPEHSTREAFLSILFLTLLKFDLRRSADVLPTHS